MKYAECVQLVSSVFKKIQAYSPEAHNTAVMIIAHESGRGKHRRQVGAAEPALGLGQMERPTFESCKKFGDRFKTYLSRPVLRVQQACYLHSWYCPCVWFGQVKGSA